MIIRCLDKFILQTLVHTPEKAVLCCWGRTRGACCAHSLQLAYCWRRSCPGSARTTTASAVWWETGCRQISSGSAWQNTAEWDEEHSEYIINIHVRSIHSKTSNHTSTVCFHHLKYCIKQQYFSCKYSQLHSLVLPGAPLWLEDHRWPWCSELEIPSPILFLWPLWRTDTGASSPAERERWDHSCMTDMTRAAQTEVVC